MFGSTRRRSYRNWPRAKALCSGGVLLKGSCTTMDGWARAQRVGLALVCTLAACCLIVSTLGLWGPSYGEMTEGTSLFPWLNRIASIQWFMRDLLIDRYPGFGKAIGYQAPNPVDWHMGGLGFLIFVARYPASRLTASLLSFVVRPLFRKRIRIRITPEIVRIGGVIIGRTMKRDDNGPEPVRFRVVSPEEYFADSDTHREQDGRLRHELGRVPPAIVEVTRGFERHKLVFARRADQAEAIVARCNHALLQTQPMLSGLP